VARLRQDQIDLGKPDKTIDKAVDVPVKEFVKETREGRANG
jgi:hypothetical protein